MKIKVSEATNFQLGWLVAKALGLEVWAGTTVEKTRYTETVVPAAVYLCDDGEEYSPSTNWQTCGPIIERERIDTYIHCTPCAGWVARRGSTHAHGPTPLIAAMRCFVASKFGNEVEVPDELR